MSTVQLSPQAREDLVSIWLYLAEQTSEDLADKFIDDLQAFCRNIAAMPGRGRAQDFIRPQLFKINFKSYSIYYDLIDSKENFSHIVIRRFWHQSRDLDNLEIDI